MRSGLKMLFVSMILFFSSLVFAAGNTTKAIDDKEVVMDTICVNGMVLKGKIINIGPSSLSFRLVNIKGINHIPYKDIDSIQTKYNYNISYKGKTISGKVVGIVNDESLQVKSAGKIKVVKISDVDRFIMTVEDDSSVENYFHNKIPYLSGSFNVGLELEDGSSMKNKTKINTDLKRKEAENEISLNVNYEYEITETSTEPKSVNKDELSIMLIDQYFYDSDDFVFAALMGEYDHPRSVDARLVPGMGYGHHFRLGKDRWVQPWIGLGYVWTRYREDDLYPESKYTAAILGLKAEYNMEDVYLINRFKIDGKILYFPSITDPNEDWSTRAYLGFTVPVYEFFTMKLSIDWINDSNPDPSIGNNKTKTNLLFGVEF